MYRVAVSGTADIKKETGVIWDRAKQNAVHMEIGIHKPVVYTPGSGIPLFNSCYVEIWLFGFHYVKRKASRFKFLSYKHF